MTREERNLMTSMAKAVLANTETLHRLVVLSRASPHDTMYLTAKLGKAMGGLEYDIDLLERT